MILSPEAFPASFSTLRLRVSYGETDRMGVAYYGHYPHWFEQARSLYIRERGMSYAEVEDRGFLLPVRELHARYLRGARFDEAVAVKAAVSKWSRASLTFVYQAFGGPDASVLLCAGETQHACVTPNGRPTAIPDWLKELLADDVADGQSP